MKFTLTSAKLLGNPGASGWTQIHEFQSEDEEKIKTRGHLFALVSKKDEDEGREIVTRFHEEYFGKLDASAFIALKNAVEKVAAEFKEKKAEIVAAVVLDDVVYAAAAGGAGVSLYRKGSLAKILASQFGETTSASGYPQEDDLLVLGTSAFFATFPEGVLKGSLAGADPTMVVESLAPSVHSWENEGVCGMVLLKFSSYSPPKEISQPPKKKLFERKIYLKGSTVGEAGERNKKTTFLVGAILLTLLVVSIVFGVKQKEIKKIKSSYQPILAQAQKEFDQAQGLINIDTNQSRQLFLASREKALGLIEKKIADKDLKALVQKMDENESLFLGIYRTRAELFLDLSLLSSGFQGTSLTFSGGKLFCFDKEGKKVAAIDLVTKKTQITAGPDQLENISQIAPYEDVLYGLSSEGIYSLGKEKKKVIEKDWSDSVLFSLYSGNVYLVDKTNSTIKRFSGVEGQFNKGTNWLAPGIELDLSKIKMMSLDGNLWLLSETAKVVKLALGNPQTFSLDLVPGSLTQIESLYANEDLKNLYLLDKSQKRVVVLDKNGRYQVEYLADTIGEATNLVVSEKEKKIVLLAGDKLYAIELKHL